MAAHPPAGWTRLPRTMEDSRCQESDMAASRALEAPELAQCLFHCILLVKAIHGPAPMEGCRSRSPRALMGGTATGKAERRWDSLRFSRSHCYNHLSLCPAEHKSTSGGTTCGILLKVFRMAEMAKRCPDAQETGYYTCKVSWPHVRAVHFARLMGLLMCFLQTPEDVTSRSVSLWPLPEALSPSEVQLQTSIQEI